MDWGVRNNGELQGKIESFNIKNGEKRDESFAPIKSKYAIV